MNKILLLIILLALTACDAPRGTYTEGAATNGSMGGYSEICINGVVYYVRGME